MVNKVAIVTDSTACIPGELVEQYEIEIVPVVFMFGNESYRDGIDMTTAEFYARLRKAKHLPTTSGSLAGPYLEAYRRASQRASSILCITVPPKLSAMFDSARIAVKMAREALPGVAIEVLNCGTAAAAHGLVILAAARAAVQGKALNEVIDIAKEVMRRVHLLASLETLRYLVKGGRVPRAAGIAASVLRIKPIFTINEGEARPLTKARTMSGAMKSMIKIIEKDTAKGQPLHIAVMHADAPDRANMLKEEISSRFNCVELLVTEFTPVMGVHTGPGLVGVAYYGE